MSWQQRQGWNIINLGTYVLFGSPSCFVIVVLYEVVETSIDVTELNIFFSFEEDFEYNIL